MSFLKRYLIALDKYKWVPLVSIALTTTAAGALTLIQPEATTQYQAQGALTLTRLPAVFSATGEQIQEAAGQDLSKDLLMTDELLRAVAAKVGVTEAEPQKLQGVMRALYQGVEIKQPDEKRKTPFLITASFTGGDRQQAERLVGSLLDGMIEQSRLINVARVQARIKTIESRLPQVIQELRAAERSLEIYNRREEADILSVRTGSLVGAIAAAEGQQRQIRLTLEGVVAQIRSLEGRLGLSTDQAYVSSALSADPIIANLRAQIFQTEQQRQVLSKDLRADHPTMVELNNRLESLESLLKQRATEVIGGGGLAAPLTRSSTTQIRQDSSLDPTRQQIANTLVALQTQRETLEQQYRAALITEQQLRQEYATIPNKQLEQQRLAQNVGLKKALYDKIQAALIDARAAEAETAPSLRPASTRAVGVEEIVVNPPIPSLLLLLGGAGAGLVLGGGLVYLLSALEGRYYTKEELQAALREQAAPLLEMLPQLAGPRDRRITAGSFVSLITDDASPYLNFYERLRGTLMRAGKRGSKVVLISSPSSDEGKTHCAYNLAIASARSGKRTVVIEADLRKPTLIRALGVAPDLGANLEPLQYYGDPSECIRLVPTLENLYIVPSTGPQRQPSAILESNEMRRLLDDCRGRFDMVIIDTPPLLRYNDALLLEPYGDGLVLLTRPGITQESMLSESLELISENKIPFFGVVINGADISPKDEPITEDELDSPMVGAVAGSDSYSPFEKVNSPSWATPN